MNRKNIGDNTLPTIKGSDLFILLLTALGMITICSRSSVLYPLNNWDDANCIFTVGKSMMNGLVPYRDLLEQKGPLMYFLYGLCWLVSHQSFLGVFLLEIIEAFFFLLFSYKTTFLIIKRRVIILIPFIALFTYSSRSFAQGGGSAEELCLPFLACSLWQIIGFETDKEKISKISLFILGFTAGCVFWIKFSLIGMYVVWFLYYSWNCIRNKKAAEIIHTSIPIACGAVAATIPWIIYFGIHGAISDWLTVYLYDNIFLYPRHSAGGNLIDKIPGLSNLLNGVTSIAEYNPAFSIIFAAAGIAAFIRKKENRIIWFSYLLFAGMFFFIYIGGRRYPYYALALCIFFSPFVSILMGKTQRIWRITESGLLKIAATSLCLLSAFFISPNTYFMKVDQNDLAQYQFRKIIAESGEDSTLLNYGGLDWGFYTVCDMIPNCRAFCQLNIGLADVRETQRKYVENGLVDYLVTRDLVNVEAQQFEKYDCIASCTCDATYNQMVFRLYKLKKEQ